MQYAEENGLKITDEPLIGGLAGYLDSVPPEDIIEVAEPVAPESEPTAEAEPNPEVPITTLEELHEAVESIVTIATEEIVEEDVFFREPPRKEVAPIIIEEKPWLPMVRNLNKIEQDDFLKQVGFPLGTEEIQFVYEFDKEPVNLPYCMTTTIPEEYLVCS
jgi:hypothetical protein